MIAVQHDERPLLTVNEAAKRLRVSVKKLRALAKAGEVSHTRIGVRGLRFSPAALEAYIEANSSAASR